MAGTLARIVAIAERTIQALVVIVATAVLVHVWHIDMTAMSNMDTPMMRDRARPARGAGDPGDRRSAVAGGARADRCTAWRADAPPHRRSGRRRSCGGGHACAPCCRCCATSRFVHRPGDGLTERPGRDGAPDRPAARRRRRRRHRRRLRRADVGARHPLRHFLSARRCVPRRRADRERRDPRHGRKLLAALGQAAASQRPAAHRAVRRPEGDHQLLARLGGRAPPARGDLRHRSGSAGQRGRHGQRRTDGRSRDRTGDDRAATLARRAGDDRHRHADRPDVQDQTRPSVRRAPRDLRSHPRGLHCPRHSFRLRWRRNRRRAAAPATI